MNELEASPTGQLEHKKLNKFQALAAFSPDALASIGYADQEIYLGLVIAGSIGLAYALPIALAITGLLAILAVSYYQIVQKYPSGGGSYEVARKTLGTVPGLVAAAALIFNYLLNVAVSLTTGVDAIASAFPVLWPHKVIISLLFLVAITLLNLRGMRESGNSCLHISLRILAHARIWWLAGLSQWPCFLCRYCSTSHSIVDRSLVVAHLLYWLHRNDGSRSD